MWGLCCYLYTSAILEGARGGDQVEIRERSRQKDSIEILKIPKNDCGSYLSLSFFVPLQTEYLQNLHRSKEKQPTPHSKVINMQQLR